MDKLAKHDIIVFAKDSRLFAILRSKPIYGRKIKNLYL